MEQKIQLVDEKGRISVYIDASITDKGDLLLSGQDLGQGLIELVGDSEYEYFLTVKAHYKDQLLLALIEKLYSGNDRVISEFNKLLDSKMIPAEFFSC